MKYFVCFVIVFAMLFTTSCSSELVEKSFEVNEFSITLDSSFKDKDASGAYAYFISRNYLIVCIKESFSELPSEYADFSEEKYAEVVSVSNEKSQDCLKNEDGYYYLEYTNKAEKKEYYYNSFIKKGESAFYIVTFTAEVQEDNSLYHTQFKAWMDTVSVS